MGARGTSSVSIVYNARKLSERAAAAGVPTRPLASTPVMRSTALAGLKTQAHRCKTTGDIETRAAFDADGLQRNRIVGTTN